MKNLLRFLLLGCFAVIVFVPIRIEYEWIVWTLLFAMFFLVAGYFWVLYGVTDKQAAELVDAPEEIRYSRFSGMVTGFGKSQDLIRGRLLITDSRLLFIKKDEKRFEIIESLELKDLSEYSSAKLLPYRQGLIFSMEDGNEYRFTIRKLKVEEAKIRTALGW